MRLLTGIFFLACCHAVTCTSYCPLLLYDKPWSSCTHSCGGGMQTRPCTFVVFGNLTRTCNEFCFNGGNFVGGRCRCSSWRTGRCCSSCRHIHIPNCKGDRKECGGTPDNIRCTECEMPFITAGWGKGCRRLLCSERNGGCDHTCLMERGVTKCACRLGFTLLSNSYSCRDIDECRTGSANCGHTCTNTDGSYTCSCRSGYSLDSDSHTCADIDECLNGKAKCEQKCINTKGTFHCSCNGGFKLSSDGISCNDINECENRNGDCQQTCVNEAGSFHCECLSGYRLDHDAASCVDIDECTESISKCSQECINTQGNYTCACRYGYRLLNDGHSCMNIDDCVGVTCSNGGKCLDNVGSFKCSCTKGFMGKRCEDDIDECSGFLNGGCEDTCINTMGSFHCTCKGNKTLNADRFSCSGSEKSETVFFRHGIVRQLLPRGCSTVLLTRCKEGKTVELFLSSTSPWFQLRSNTSIVYTFGIVFVEVNELSLPISITGLEIVKHNDDFTVITGSLSIDDKKGVIFGEDRNVDCVSFQTTPKDIHDLLQASSFLKTVYDILNKILPDWLSFSQKGTEILGVNDLHTDILNGKAVQSGECRGAPLYDDRLYTVIKFGSSFSLSLYGDEVVLPNAIKNEQYCLIIDVCQDYGGSLFVILPKESRDTLDKFNLLRHLKDKYGVRFRPVGLGLSLFKHINVHFSAQSLQLWNGDRHFDYRVMPEANLWLGGGAEMTYSRDTFSVDVRANSDVYFSVPSPKDILKNLFLDEWNVLLKLDVLGSMDIRFRLFGHNHKMSLKNILASGIDAYASVGGQSNRVLCGEDANPPGIFLSLMVDINPFKDVPVLKDWVFDFNNRVYAYLATNPTMKMTHSNDMSLIGDLLNYKENVEIFINTTVANVIRYSSLFLNQSAKLLKVLEHTASEFSNAFERFIREYSHGNSIQNLIDSLSAIWSNGWKILQADTRLFLDSIEHVTVIAKYNFSSLLTQEVDVLKDKLQNIRNKVVQQLLNVFKEYQGFGLRYKGNIKIFHINIVGLEIEFVYSSARLGSCSRFNELFDIMKDEHAVKIYAVVSSGIFKIAPFLRMKVGAGLGIVLGIDSPGKQMAQLHAEASVLGMSGSVDVFLTEHGHYFYLQGKVWNTFKAELKVSFESNTQYGVVDTFDVKATFLANAGDGSSFQDSYFDGLRKLIRKLADEADKRISLVQDSLTSAEKSLTEAQNWLEDKKLVVRSANAKFDEAIESLEHAKRKLEDAKGPFRNAMSKLNEAQRKVDNLCRIRHCRQICFPGIKCRICWKKVWFVKIPLPCCHFTSCMFSFPDPLCVMYNLGCRAIRGLAYIALEAAKVFVRVPMLALDAAKGLISVAQFVVDKSRVVLDIAVAALDIAKIGLEGAKHILEGAKITLEVVKKVVGWGLKALDFIIQYGLQSIVDVKNCGFELKVSAFDTTVFRVTCELNLFRQGFRRVEIGINFGNPIQSIWQAAKGTIDAFVDASGQHTRNKRELKSYALSGLHKVIRKIREADIDSENFDLYVNETMDAVFRTSGFKNNTSSGDYENRVELFEEKCDITKNSVGFFTEAIQVLLEMASETARTINNASSIEDELVGFNIHDMASNFSIENIGVNTEAAFKDFNISAEDIDGAMEKAKNTLSNDSLLSGIDDLSRDAKILIQNQTKDANNMKLLDQWIIVAENVTNGYFTEDECVSFLDCSHFAVFQLYGTFDAENVTNMTKSLDAISLFENLFLELTGNLSHTITEIHDLAGRLSETLASIDDLNAFCAKPPQMMSPLMNHTIRKGENLHLICNVTGNPQPTVWWYCNGDYLPEQTNPDLIIRNVSQSDAQKYHCIAGNIVANLSVGYADVVIEDDAPDTDIDKEWTTTDLLTGTDGEFLGPSFVEQEALASSDISVIIGTTVSAFVVIIAIVVAVAWRKYMRNKMRKSKGPGSLVSVNMIRPDVSKPVFTMKVK